MALPVATTPATGGDHRTKLEELVAGTWSVLLGRPQVSVHDNFFELGGHSLLAAQLVSRLRKVVGVEIPVRSIFDYPTVAMLAAALEENQHSQQGLIAPPLVPVARGGPLPTSFGQQQLWLLDQLHPDSIAYSATDALRIHGPLQIGALEQAVQGLVDRHEVLRTHFQLEAGEPMQIIEPTLAMAVSVENLCELSVTEKAEIVPKLVECEARKPFDLQRGPLLRVRLLRLGEAEHVCVVSLHHIVTDGWSHSILVKELSELYAAVCEGRPPRLRPLSIQYADYAVWQRESMHGELVESQLVYWREQLRDAVLLSLPTDRQRSDVAGDPGAIYQFRICAAVTAGLRSLAHYHHATLFMVVLAAWQAFLARYCGQSDIAIGTPIANRTQEELEPLVGLLLNILVIRTDLRDDPSFRVLVARVRERVLEAYAHQDVPFEHVVAAVQPQRMGDQTPLFRVMFTWHNEPTAAVTLAGVTWEPVPYGTHGSKFDLTLGMRESADTLEAMLEYRVDLFDETTIARLSMHFQRLLAALVAQPDERTSVLPMLDDTEYKELLTWSEVHDAI